MIKTITSLAALLAVQAAFAQPAVFQGDTLHIFRGAVINDDGSISYFRDIRLDLNGDGDFEVADAMQANLAEAHTVAALATPDADSLEVMVEGWLSSSCVELEPPAVIYDDLRRNITIVLAEVQLDTGELCVEVVEPFTTQVDVDISGLSAGQYTVNVNGEEQSMFSLSGEQAMNDVPDGLGAPPTSPAPDSDVVDPDPGAL